MMNMLVIRRRHREEITFTVGEVEIHVMLRFESASAVSLIIDAPAEVRVSRPDWKPKPEPDEEQP
jgi:sRNA-binding carbon storage regulator CsrA